MGSHLCVHALAEPSLTLTLGLDMGSALGKGKLPNIVISRELESSSNLGFALLLSLGILRMPRE